MKVKHMQIRLARTVILAAIFSATIATAQAGTNAVIENQWLRVRVDSASNTFAIRDRGTGNDFVKAAKLARPVASITAVRDVEDPVWGSG